MHDSLAYARDTWIVDVDDAPHPSPSLPRVATEELTMQVYVNGEWHRRMPTLEETSCEQSIDGQRCPVRRNELSGDLCGVCHTPAEMKRCAENNAKENG